MVAIFLCSAKQVSGLLVDGNGICKISLASLASKLSKIKLVFHNQVKQCQTKLDRPLHDAVRKVEPPVYFEATTQVASDCVF